MKNDDQEKDQEKDQENPASSDAESGPAPGSIPLLEWLVAALGLVLVLAVIGVMGFEAFTDDQSPPDISVSAEAIVPNSAGYVVQIRIVNQGSNTAAAVLIEGELMQGSASIETSEATIDYVPDSSARHGGLFFTHDPAQFELILRTKGYQEP